ncbi:hypothetical protein O3J88_21105, partial [Yersinia pestis]|nr:hypothetical protein [Yersinia pestis]
MGTAQYIHQKNGPQVVTFMLEERQGCFSGQSLLLEFCWAVLCLSTILVPWLLEACAANQNMNQTMCIVRVTKVTTYVTGCKYQYPQSI